MKKILVTAAIVLITTHTNAQTGMPKTLTCTEEAFNISFNLGTKWKLTAPKMGPVDATSYEQDYIPGWSLKPNEEKPETPLLPLVEKPLNIEAFNYLINPQNYAPLSYRNTFSLMDKPDYLLFGINSNPSIIYKVLWANFSVNSISYSQ